MAFQDTYTSSGAPSDSQTEALRVICSNGKNTYDNHPRGIEFEDFAAFRAAALRVKSPKKGLAYVCAPMSDGHRCKESALPRRCLPFDLDGIAGGEAFSELLQWFGRFNGFAYTTASSTPEAPRCRVVVELSRPVDRAEGVRLGRAIETAVIADLGEGRYQFDGRVYRAEQPIFLPTEGCAPYTFDGEAVDVDTWLRGTPADEPERPSAKERAEQAANADPVVARLYERGMVKKNMGDGKLAVVCPCEDAHTSESNESSTVYYLPNHNGYRYSRFHCLHAHCENRPQEEFLEALALNPQEVWRQRVFNNAASGGSALPTKKTALGPWREPEPLTSAIDPLPYPIDSLPPGVRDAVLEVHRFVQAPMALVAASALTNLSLAVQHICNVERSRGLSGPISLNSLIIAESGERKTTCDGLFASAVRAYEADEWAHLEPLIQHCQAAHDAWQAKVEGVKAGIRDAAKKRKPTADLQTDLDTLRASEPQIPRTPRMLYGDATVESLNFGLATRWPSAGLISSEGGAFFGGHGMSPDARVRTVSSLNQHWDGVPQHIDRRTSESYVLRDARLTVGLQVQEGVLREAIERSGDLLRSSGFFARALIAWPESTQGTREFKEAPDSFPALDQFGRRLTELLKAPEGVSQLSQVSLSQAAKNSWIAFYNEVESELRAGGEYTDIKDVASKSADNCARLAALFQIYETGAGCEVDEVSMLSACVLMRWYLRESLRFFGQLSTPRSVSDALKVEQWLLSNIHINSKGIFERRFIQNRSPVRDGARLTAALQTLEEHTHVQVIYPASRVEVALNPALIP